MKRQTYPRGYFTELLRKPNAAGDTWPPGFEASSCEEWILADKRRLSAAKGRATAAAKGDGLLATKHKKGKK
jgi:hypothetical protein